MTDLLSQAIGSVQNSTCAFCHYITPNDAGKTGSHQAGFYLPKDAQGIILGDKAKRGSNADIFIKIKNEYPQSSKLAKFTLPGQSLV